MIFKKSFKWKLRKYFLFSLNLNLYQLIKDSRDFPFLSLCLEDSRIFALVPRKGANSWSEAGAAAVAAESLQSCLTLCDPIDGSLPGSPVPGILQARTLEWVATSFSKEWKWKGKVKLLSRVRLFMTPWTTAHQAPPSMGFSRQEYWRTLLNSLISCSNFLILSLGFSMYSIMQTVRALLLSFWSGFLLFLFLLWLLQLGLPELGWIIVVKVNTLVLFLILGGMLSVFHHLE